MSGFIALHRDATEHPLFVSNAERFGAWFWLVTMAAWKETRHNINGKIVRIERGQLCTSRSYLATQWGWSPSKVERFLTRLKTEHMIEQATGQGKSVITICNYETYQDINREAGQATGQRIGQPSDSHRTTKEQGNKGTSNLSVDKSTSLNLEIQEPDKPSEIDEALICWNLAAARHDWGKVKKLTDTRRSKLKSRLREHGLDGWKDALRRAMASEQLGHDPPTWWKFDFLVKNEENILKVLEGNYDKRFGGNGGTGQGSGPSGQPVNPLVQAIAKRQADRAGKSADELQPSTGGWP